MSSNEAPQGEPAALRSNDELGLVEKLRQAATRKWPDEANQRHSLFGEAAAEIERLTEEVQDLDGLRDRMGGLLQRTAVALRGPEPPLTRWGWHDLPERAEAAIASIALVQAAERERAHNAGFVEASRLHGAEIERLRVALTEIQSVAYLQREPHWSYRNTITTNRDRIKALCAKALEA